MSKAKFLPGDLVKSRATHREADLYEIVETPSVENGNLYSLREVRLVGSKIRYNRPFEMCPCRECIGDFKLCKRFEYEV